MSIEVTCCRCNGTGKESLGKHLAETLSLLSKLGRASAIDIHERIDGKIGVTAINNRLNDLCELGLAQRERYGKFWIYEVRR